MIMKHMLKGLYAISDERLTPYNVLPQYLESALKAGIKIFQLRDKSHSDEWLYDKAKVLMGLCEKYNAIFVINDRLDLALKLNAPALHLGKDDISITKARECFKGILGASSYGDVSRAKDLESLGVDYVAFGAFFPSLTKPNANVISTQILKTAREFIRIPICAIGGISTNNIHLLKNADMCAVISSLWVRSENLSEESLNSKRNLINHSMAIYHNACNLCRKFSQSDTKSGT